MPRKSHLNERHGRWFVIGNSSNWHPDNQLWLCRCDCGTEKEVAIGSLRSGRSRSCGCLNYETNATHRMSRTPTYTTWHGMTQRCCNPKNPNYVRYGGRGIAVCERWLTFENFLADMGKRPAGTTLDRINNELGYQPDNCHWASSTEQNRNSRHTKLNVVAVCLIRHLRRRGARLSAIGHAFGITSHHASGVVSRQSWSDTFHVFPRTGAHPELPSINRAA